MNRRLLLLLFLACVLVLNPGCDRRGLNAKDRSEFSPISKGISRASSLLLYEGLPHQFWEADQFKKELAAKKTLLFHEFPFYERPLSVTPVDVETLRRLSAAANSFSSCRGAKACGGYHPDYCLIWKDGATTYELFICFGCHEMELYGPQQDFLADIRPDAFTQFETTLKKYRDQRPQSK